MKCPSVKNSGDWSCDGKYSYPSEFQFKWFRIGKRRVFPLFWKPRTEYFYCPMHGSFDRIDGKWWWFSYFRQNLYLEEDTIAFCPRKCWGKNWSYKEVHKGRDGRYYCGHCSWSGDRINLKVDDVTSDGEMHRRLKREIARMKKKEADIERASEESFEDFLNEQIGVISRGRKLG